MGTTPRVSVTVFEYYELCVSTSVLRAMFETSLTSGQDESHPEKLLDWDYLCIDYLWSESNPMYLWFHVAGWN